MGSGVYFSVHQIEHVSKLNSFILEEIFKSKKTSIDNFCFFEKILSFTFCNLVSYILQYPTGGKSRETEIMVLIFKDMPYSKRQKVSNFIFDSLFFTNV